MDNARKKVKAGLTPSQIAWVVKDIEKSKAFFQEMFGVTNFSPTGTTRLQDYDGTYYGQPADAENLVTMTYSGGTLRQCLFPARITCYAGFCR
jgi:predicted enzyme related to lactoylglutathione lyase